MSTEEFATVPSTGIDRNPQPLGNRAWVLAAVVLAASTALFNAKFVSRLDQRRTVNPEVAERYSKFVVGNDTTGFLNQLERSAGALREGKVYFPVSDYDCPITYLLVAGATVLLTGWPPLVVHNLFFLTVFFLNGLSAFALLRSLARSTPPALLGALVYQSCNYAFMCHCLGHMHNAQMQWIPLVFLALCRMARRDSGWGWPALLGIGMGLQVLSSPYYTLYLAYIALPIFTLVYWVGALRSRLATDRDLARFALRTVCAMALAALVSGFYLVPRLGSPPSRYLLPWYRPYALDHYLELLDPSDPALFIGLPMFVLTVLALRWWYFRPRPLTTAVVVTMVGSLLMMLPALPGTPYWVYYHVFPMIDRLRVPLRFFPIFNLMLITLITLYLDDVFRNLTPARRWGLSGVVLLALLALNWLASPWVFDGDLVSFAKRLLDHKSPVLSQPRERPTPPLPWESPGSPSESL
jgi:hypothetical protein